MTAELEIEEVVYSAQEAMPFNKDEEARVRKLLEEPIRLRERAKKFALDWYGPTFGILSIIGTLVVALHFFVKPDVTALNTSMDAIHNDIKRIDEDIRSENNRISTVVTETNTRIDTVMSQAMDKVLAAASKSSARLPTVSPSKGGTPRDDASLRDDLSKIRTILALATGTDVKLGRERVISVSTGLRDIAAAQPGLSSVAWETMASLLNYNSAVTTPPEIRWMPTQGALNGFPGLFGLVEMKNVELFPSVSDVELRHGFWCSTLRRETETYRRLEEEGIRRWPEFAMAVGGVDSTVVLDNLHVRNVVFKHLRIVYGGGQTVLENVTFTDCTFALVKTQRTVELTEVLLKDQSITFGL